MHATRARPDRIEVVVVLGVIALLGILAAPLPFTGDQALFAAGARQLAHGDVLYRDFWDVKQPGIYGFYLAGGSLFGYSEVALHLFEVGYQLVFAAILILTLRGTFSRRWIAPLVALVIFGTYYATVEPVELGQVESLVGLPIYLSLWCSLRAIGGLESRATARRLKRMRARLPWLVASGFFGGVVLVFKLVLGPIVGAFWLFTIWELWRVAPTARLRSVGWGIFAIGCGVLVPLGAVGAYLAAYGQLDTVRWTYFDVTSQATALGGRPLSRLFEGGFRTSIRWALPLSLGLIGIVTAVRRGWDRLEIRLAAWLLVGVPIFLVQHWWIYTYAMFLVPVGIFAGYGLDAFMDAWPRLRQPMRVAICALAVLLAVPAAVRFAGNGRDVARHDFALSADDRAALRQDLEPDYVAAQHWASWLRAPTTAAGGVYVLGNPLDLYLSDRKQTVSINGWSPEQYPEAVWNRLRGEIATARPVHLIIDQFSNEVMQERSPETLKLIDSQYRHVGRSGPDGWYQLKETTKSG